MNRGVKINVCQPYQNQLNSARSDLSSFTNITKYLLLFVFVSHNFFSPSPPWCAFAARGPGRRGGVWALHQDLSQACDQRSRSEGELHVQVPLSSTI